MKNPIINNRIVRDETFAVRLKAFVEETNVCDAMSEEEKEYLLMVANELIAYQAETATDEWEVAYLKRLNLIA